MEKKNHETVAKAAVAEGELDTGRRAFIARLAKAGIAPAVIVGIAASAAPAFARP